MKNKNRYSTAASHRAARSLATSHRAARSLFALGAAVTALVAPALLTGCGSGGGGDPDPSPSTSGDRTIITGQIVDVNAGSAGVAGATVRFAGVSVQTNASGNFSLTIPRNTAPGVATITAPAGSALYPYASINTPSFSCANSPSFSVTGPFTGSTFVIGNVFVYGRTSATVPAPPCIPP